MRCNITILFISLLNVFIFAQEMSDDYIFTNNSYFSEFASVKFIDDSLKFYNYRNEKIEGKFEIIDKSNLIFLSIHSSEEDLSDKHWLLLASEKYMIILGDEGNVLLEGVSDNSISVYRANTYLTTSELVENSMKYSAEFLGTINSSMPWVEGASGPGIGEKIIIEWPIWEYGGIKSLLIGNGYISYKNPYLYNMNNRVKEIRINSSGFSPFIVQLDDNPNPQEVKLPNPVQDMTIEIISVYSGSKWDDTCLNFILGIGTTISESLELRAKNK